MKLFKTLKTLLIAFLISMPVIVSAQPEDPDDDVIDVPLDGGVCVLVAAGIAYGLKKAHDKKKTEKEDVF